ncbi:anamorsin-like protein, partial [Leptotrombidium deliense]
LKLCGFLDVKETRDVVEAIKPSFEIGSSVKLSFNKNGPSTESLKKWQLAVDEYNEGKENDLIDDNELLDEADLIKPDPESLRVCGTTGKRKACANCTCGLAEELNNAEISSLRQNTQQAKSSCGSCYLGDAFRCADCPYIGLPAFKPGEKVIIDNSSDI